MGGLLSAYELSGKQHQVLVEKAKQVADKLSKAWVGVREQAIFSKHNLTQKQLNDVPFSHVDFTSDVPQIATVCV